MSDLRARAEAATPGGFTEQHGDGFAASTGDGAAVAIPVVPTQDAPGPRATQDSAGLWSGLADRLTNDVPDVTTSDVPASPDAAVVVAWSRVMADVEWIGKVNRREDVGGRYNFRGIDAVLNAVGPVLRKHGVIVLPVKIEPEYSTVPTANNKVMNYCRVTVAYAVFGPTGDRMPVDLISLGEAFDAGDKSSTKAQSVALRTLYINALNIPTREPDRDTEHGPQYEMAAPPPPTPMSYRDEITDPRTPRDRLRQIYRELGRHPDLGAALVPGRQDGAAPSTLADLLTVVIAERFPQRAES